MGLNREGAYLKCRLRGEGFIRNGVLIGREAWWRERLNGAFAVCVLTNKEVISRV